MKKLLRFLSATLLLSVFAFSFSSCSDDDDEKRIDFSTEVPETARNFVAEHFAGEEVWYAEKDGRKYEVKLKNNTELDFDSEGVWMKVDVDKNVMPSSVLLLLNGKILEYINKNYANNTIKEVEKKGQNLEIELNNNIDLIFNAKGEFVSSSGGGKPSNETINYDDLPQASKDFITAHFPNATVVKAEKDKLKYEVDLNDGTEIDFYSDGSFKSIEAASQGKVPDSVIMPVILDYIKANHSGKTVKEYSKLSSFFTGEYAGGYKAELSGQPETDLFFNKEGGFLKQIND